MAKVYISTTSFKEENFVDMLEVYKKLGWTAIDINLSPLLFQEANEAIHLQALRNLEFNIGFASGGWCDFFHTDAEWKKTEVMVDRQVAAIKKINVDRLRLFFGRLHREDYTNRELETVTKNISYFGKKYPEIKFSFENHDGASLDPKIVTEMIRSVDLANVGLTLDPVNYARVGSSALEAIRLHKDKIFHVHVKGLTADRHYCEYGAGDFDYHAVLKELKAQNYSGDFTLEYEGESNAILRIYKSLKTLSSDLKSLGFIS